MRILLNIVCMCCSCSQMFCRLSRTGQHCLVWKRSVNCQAMCQAGRKTSVSEAWRIKACGVSHLKERQVLLVVKSTKSNITWKATEPQPASAHLKYANTWVGSGVWELSPRSPRTNNLSGKSRCAVHFLHLLCDCAPFRWHCWQGGFAFVSFILTSWASRDLRENGCRIKCIIIPSWGRNSLC